MMTEVDLCKELSLLLRAATAGLGNEIPEEKRAPPPGHLRVRKPRPGGLTGDDGAEDGSPEEPPEPRTGVRVFTGYVPPAAEGDNVPFVSVLPQSISFARERTVMQLNLDLCTYASKDDDPFRAMLNLVHRVCGALLELPDRCLAERYELTDVSECAFDPENYEPFLHAVISTRWEWPSPFSVTTNLDQ